MKKLFFFAAAALALAACSNDELNVQDEVRKVSQEATVNFDVYAQRGMTRGGTPGTLDNKNIGKIGFGVFAYYTAGEQYDPKATPNFMYNQKVYLENDAEATPNSLWKYEPVKYWPNEYGNAAISDEVDYLTFFAYAPWTEIEPTTGNVKIDETKKPAQNQNESEADYQKRVQAWKDNLQKLNIISVNKNTASGDPLVKYVVDTDPATSVDLLWGVAAETAGDYYTPIDAAKQNAGVEVKAGYPFLNLVKPNNPQSDRLQFNLKHALAKVKVTIDYIADDFTPTGTSQDINPAETRIYVRSFKMSGFAGKGALNLNNTTAGEPLWKDFDGVKDLAFDEITFQDGRKDGKEGETNGAQNNETPQGLNPNIVENYAPATGGTFGQDKTPGVTKDPQLLFGGTATAGQDDGFFYIIPRNEQGGKVDVTIAYDVETIDEALAGKLSDGETHGTSIENIISKNDIFGGMDFRAGYQYEINIHLGMTSVKVEATVTEWKNNGQHNVDLPDNQLPAAVTAINYKYDGWNYNGKFYASDNDVCYVTTATQLGRPQLDDFARFLGALHRAAGVNKITYNGKEYTWNPTRIYELGLVEDPNATELKGSNWFNEDEGTLVSVISTAAQNQSLASPLTITADNEDIKIYLGPNYSFTSYGKNPDESYTQYATGKVLVTDGGVQGYKKALVVENEGVDGFVGKTYYIAANAADDGQTHSQLFDAYKNPLPIWVTIQKIQQP